MAGPASHSLGFDGTRCPTVRAPFPLWTLPSASPGPQAAPGADAQQRRATPMRPGSQCPMWVGMCIPQLGTTQGPSDPDRPQTAANHPHMRQRGHARQAVTQTVQSGTRVCACVCVCVCEHTRVCAFLRIYKVLVHGLGGSSMPSVALASLPKKVAPPAGMRQDSAVDRLHGLTSAQVSIRVRL